MPLPIPYEVRRGRLGEGQGGYAIPEPALGVDTPQDGNGELAMTVGVVLAILVVAFVGWLSRGAFHNIRTGKYPRNESSEPGLPPPSGPDVSDGIGGV